MPDKTHASILYVDDDAAMVRLVQRVFGRRGYEVFGAPTIDEALKRIADGGIDVIALDHFLAGETGLDLLARLKDFPSAPPVVYVTGSAETAIAVAALKAGAADYVPKAVDEEFIELLHRAFDQAREKATLQRERDRAQEELRAARDRAELLLHEVNHRVANSLMLVASLVRMSGASIEDPAAKSALVEIQTRILAIAGVHRKLYTRDDPRAVEISEYLSSLLEDLTVTMREAGHGSKIQLVADEANVSTDRAVSVGIVVTELVTNAFKYAYPEGQSGEIRVELRRIAEDRVRLSVDDDGVGFMGDGTPKGTGVGSRIVNALSRGLGTEVRYEAGRGCHVSLEFGVTQAAAEASV